MSNVAVIGSQWGDEGDHARPNARALRSWEAQVTGGCWLLLRRASPELLAAPTLAMGVAGLQLQRGRFVLSALLQDA